MNRKFNSEQDWRHKRTLIDASTAVWHQQIMQAGLQLQQKGSEAQEYHSYLQMSQLSGADCADRSLQI